MLKYFRMLLLFFAVSCYNLAFAAEDLSGTYRLKTQFRGSSECLEGNQSTSSPIGGAAFMNLCSGFPNQLWKVESAGLGWYWLKIQFTDGEECLQGNWIDSPVYNGAAFMDTCRNVTGQFWQFVPKGNQYLLKTQLRGGRECLEGNQATSSIRDGKAFMDTCHNVSGQLWILEPVSDENIRDPIIPVEDFESEDDLSEPYR